MMNVSQICQDQTARRQRIRDLAQRAESNEPNGIDYVEVDETQKVITVYFLNKAPFDIQPQNVLITGGVRVRDIQVIDIRLCRVDDPDRDDCMKVFVDKYGDFSSYTLKLVNAPGGRPGESPLTGFDPRYAQIEFSFKANCPSDLDCLPAGPCYPLALPEPEISYLARDYNSFRQLIFDRLALTMPNWKERHVPDIGVALVEVLAYVGDYLSYYQDAVATEAYLATARERISVRRHALLVDYRMHEGCNARTWVCVMTDRDVPLEHPEDIYFITGTDTAYNTSAMLQHRDLQGVPREQYEVFEPLLPRLPGDTILIYQAHNTIEFYTWGDQECCLPRGTTSATLKDEWKDSTPPEPPQDEDQYGGYRSRGKKQVRRGAGYEEERYDEERYQQRYPKKKPGYEPPPPVRERALKLKPGDVLIFEEVLGPKTGVEPDADRSHRHAVCLTRVEPGVDELYGQPILNIEWTPEDALPFTLCLSSIGPAPECLPLTNVSVARGNVILVDHGSRQVPEPFSVPGTTEIPAGCIGPFEPRETILRTQSLTAPLKYGPVTYRVPYPLQTDIGRTQVQFLSAFMKRVRLHFEQMWKQVTAGEPLSEKELAELITVFGRSLLVRLKLIAAGTREKHEEDPKRQAEILARLLGRFDEFLTKKSKRLGVLRSRVMSGYVLTRDEENEIREMFGPDLAGDLGFLNRQMLGPASGALRQQPRDALPCVDVFQSDIDPLAYELRAGARKPDTKPRPQWTPQHNLLESDGLDRHFVVEVDNDGHAHLRFGNGELGRAPEPDSSLEAIYRVGNGSSGNVGAESISYIVFRRAGSIGANLTVRNPLPAQGGIEPEPIAEVKMFAPKGFRKELQRAITADDYARLAELVDVNKIQRAAGDLRWAGSWYEMQTAIDPLGVQDISPQLKDDLLSSLYRYRRIGHDVSIANARYVPLNIAIQVCVLPSYLRGHVKAALIDVFSNRVLPNGQRGFFHPDNLSFGQGIYLSSLVAAAQAVEGVESVRVTRLERLYEGDKGELADGVLRLSPLEVARNDNDPSFPEHGLFVLDVGGGR